MPDPDIYDTGFVSRLFDRMAQTYGVTNYLSSFGFSEIWRRRCVDRVDWTKVRATATVLDLMSGMGECWHLVRRATACPVTGVDISPVMVRKSIHQATRNRIDGIRVLQEDVLNTSLAGECADVIISSFGLKTFNDRQQRELAVQVGRLLRPGGAFSFVEISVPPFGPLRAPYMFYLRRVIPLIGKYFAGDDHSYRYLGVYTEAFSDARSFAGHLRDNRLEVTYHSYFFGCATGVTGRKPPLTGPSETAAGK